ncbi:hypothetical protein K400107F7_03480 [Agathobaculum massiliense]
MWEKFIEDWKEKAKECVCGDHRRHGMTNTELYHLALSTYGAEAQTLMVMEEMSELQKELCKHARGKDNQLSIAEEIADVLIMLDQMMILHDCESIVAQYKQEKLERLENRIVNIHDGEGGQHE